ncbi:hypothetical protein NM688_g3141 [Phlebia brevispora]|uniref:Uncharacterized protein n=1 Tax=Phlebia brevispora TaxID=194682 RepID=A0ACC1T6N3_9APHY|nr:hypothetical protein NM688_g3141 [Phlebia brevispora]
MSEIVHTYIRSRYNPDQLLRPYFKDTIGFRNLQARTGILISGTAALQFYLRMQHSGSTLELHVRQSERETVEKWLLDAGYSLSPHHEDHENSPGALLSELSGIARISVYRNNILMAVRVVTAISSPLEVVLRQQCMTHDMAYCLYPGATLEDKRSLILRFGDYDTLHSVGVLQHIDRDFKLSWSLSVGEDERIYYPELLSDETWKAIISRAEQCKGSGEALTEVVQTLPEPEDDERAFMDDNPDDEWGSEAFTPAAAASIGIEEHELSETREDEAEAGSK